MLERLFHGDLTRHVLAFHLLARFAAGSQAYGW
jgi:hypothetical protein